MSEKEKRKVDRGSQGGAELLANERRQVLQRLLEIKKRPFAPD
jgi:hypothetical protein